MHDALLPCYLFMIFLSVEKKNLIIFITKPNTWISNKIFSFGGRKEQNRSRTNRMSRKLKWCLTSWKTFWFNFKKGEKIWIEVCFFFFSFSSFHLLRRWYELRYFKWNVISRCHFQSNLYPDWCKKAKRFPFNCWCSQVEIFCNRLKEKYVFKGPPKPNEYNGTAFQGSLIKMFGKF